MIITTIALSHHAPVDLGLFGISWDATSVGALFGPQWATNHYRHAPSHISCWDLGLGYPKIVPWDQNFGLKIFLILSSDDVILWVLWVGLAKNVEKWEERDIFDFSLSIHKGCSWIAMKPAEIGKNSLPSLIAYTSRINFNLMTFNVWPSWIL